VLLFFGTIAPTTNSNRKNETKGRRNEKQRKKQ
jgi:hypothetical protein